MSDTNLNRLCSLSEEEVQERYEKKPSAPIAEDDQDNAYLDPNIQNEKARQKLIEDSNKDFNDVHTQNVQAKLKLLEQSKLVLDIEEPYKDGLRLRKSIEAGELQAHDSDSDEDDENTDKTVNTPIDDDDYQRPAKLDLIVGFLRLFNFISCCTSVFAVVLSILYPLSETEPTLESLWAPLDVSPEEFYRTKREVSGTVWTNKAIFFFM